MRVAGFVPFVAEMAEGWGYGPSVASSSSLSIVSFVPKTPPPDGDVRDERRETAVTAFSVEYPETRRTSEPSAGSRPPSNRRPFSRTPRPEVRRTSNPGRAHDFLKDFYGR